jgi:hypothetical protein
MLPNDDETVPPGKREKKKERKRWHDKLVSLSLLW